MSPLHVILATLGTDGDVFPYVGLGAALRGRGHRVTLVADERYAAIAHTYGLGFRSLMSASAARAVFDPPEFWHPLKGPIHAARLGAGLIPAQYELLAELVAEGPAVIAASPGVIGARLVQEKLGTPMASIVLQPWMIQSDIVPPIMPGGLTLPRWAPAPLKGLYWCGVDAVGALLLGRTLNRCRRELALAPVRRVFRWWLSPERVIGLFDPAFGPPQEDWLGQIRLAGFPAFDGAPPGAGLPPDVRAFCDDGPPPIAFTFGTGMLHAHDLHRAAVEACGLLSVRGILLTHHGEQLPSPLPPNVLHCAFAPFSQLFPRCAAVVHHGGIGTVAKALAAGVPQLVLPIAYDQFDNAARVKRLGAGDWLKRGKRDVGRVARALELLMRSEGRARGVAAVPDDAGANAFERASAWIEELAAAHGTA